MFAVVRCLGVVTGRAGLKCAYIGLTQEDKVIRFHALHDLRRYAMPQCWTPHT